MMIYTPARKPWAHQEEALRRSEGKENFAFLMAMRTGKTFVTLADYGRNELSGNVKNLAVIAPGGVYETWLDQCNEHFSFDLKQRALIHTWQSSAGAGHKKRLDMFMNEKDRPRVLLINDESLSRHFSPARDTIMDFLNAGPCMTAIDECTIIKNPSSNRTKFINKEVAGASDMRRILSGLPTPKSPLDLYCEFEFLDWRILGHRSYYSFRSRYAIIVKIPIKYKDPTGAIKTREAPLIKGYRDVENLQVKIAPHSYRCTLKDIYDVPDKIYSIRKVPLTGEQRRIYRELRDNMMVNLGEPDVVVNTEQVIVKILKLHQILCGHVSDNEGNIHEIPENRTSELLGLLEDYDGKAIVWCSYDLDVKKVSAALEKDYGEGSVARFWGGNKPTREDEEKRFKTDPICRFMVATPAAGGRGRDWAVANLIIYYSNSDNLEFRDQSEERGQKVGKADPCAMVDLMVPDTVDEKIIHALRKKIDLATAITNDGYREWLI